MTFDPKTWLDDLLKTRGLDRPDGRSLHAYRVKDEEFELLCQGLADWTSIESGSHARLSILKDRYWFSWIPEPGKWAQYDFSKRRAAAKSEKSLWEVPACLAADGVVLHRSTKGTG